MANLNNQVFLYQGSNITFQNGDTVTINATEMAKPFGKQVAHFLQNANTKRFIEELANIRNLIIADLVAVRGGSPENGGGTWMHEDVAMEFARWLSPAFAIWCNDRIKELLKQGVSVASNDDALVLKAMQVLQDRVAAKNRDVRVLTEDKVIMSDRIKRLEKQVKRLTVTVEARPVPSYAPLATDEFFEWRDWVNSNLMFEDHEHLAQMLGVGVRHVRKVIQGTARSEKLRRILTFYIKNKYGN